MALISEVKPIIHQSDGGAGDTGYLSGASLSASAEVSLAAMLPVVAVALLAGILIGRHQGASKPRRKPSAPPAPAPPLKEELAAESDLSTVSSWEMAETRFCPICYGEYVTGTTLCEDCGVELVEEAEVPLNDPPIDENLVRICQINGLLRSQMIRQYLAAYRIPCSMTRSLFGDAIGSDVFVFESDALRAKKLIHQYLTDFEGTPV